MRRVDAYLARGFRYDERPAPPDAGEVPLEHFLFETKAGYCQHFSGAMALMLRFGGVPARVATGFSPGGFRRRQGEWVVRDRDAHSWVEAWFDGIGWVTFDPTPTATPARSLIAAIDEPGAEAAGDSAADAAATQPGTRNPAGARGELDPAAGQGGGPGVVATDSGPSPWLLAGARPRPARAGGRASCSCCAGAAARATALPTADRAVADLVVALRRAGRPVTPGTTLVELERRLHGGRDADSYLATLRAARYGTARPADARPAPRVPPRARRRPRLARPRPRVVGAAAAAELMGSNTTVLWTIVAFLAGSLLFGSLRRATEDSSTLVTVAVQVGALALVIGVVVLIVRRLPAEAPRPGFEPGAYSLGGSRSIQLSYRGLARQQAS